LRIGKAAQTAIGLELRDVSLLGDRVQADRLGVPSRGLAGAVVDGLRVDGRAEVGTANAILALGGSSYVVVLQQAVVPGSGEGVVGLRVYVGEETDGLLTGTQILVGLARAAVPGTQKPSQQWQLLGVAPAVDPAESGIAFPGITDPFPSLQTAGPIGVRAAAIVQQYLGIQYVWAGADPTTGFDCSGLTMFVYRQLGVELVHFTGSQWYSGRRIPIEELAPGDLVFFNMRAYGPGHEGLYIGGGKFVEAPRRGTVVRISNLADRAFSYVGAVRPYQR
jgi:hypothetical protein